MKEQTQVIDEQLPEAASETQPSEVETGAPALSGTVGRILKWISPTTFGDSNVWEDGLNDVYFSHDIGLAGRVRTGQGIRFGDGSVQTTAAPTQVYHGPTLDGRGTSAEPLEIAVPLTLKGGVSLMPVISVTNTGPGYGGKFIGGTHNLSSNIGLLAAGGDSDSGEAGDGVYLLGGYCNGGTAGSAITCIGGRGNEGGAGINAFAGYSTSTRRNVAAGHFYGDVEIHRYGGLHPNGNLLVSGTVTSGTGMFKIDHPLDPENKYLQHAAVESPDMKTIHDGNVTTDARGEALVQLPDYFEAANRDFRYQLTVIGTFAQAIVASEIKENRFLIKTSEPNVKVSWQVTGIRQDAFANAHRIKVEEEKPSDERGYYLHAAEHGQPAERMITSSRHSELMRRVDEARDMALKP